MLDIAPKKRSRINDNAQFGASLLRLALHGRAAIDAAAAWALVSRSAFCRIVRDGSRAHTPRVAERSSASN
jgi:hypothetical protein